MKSQELREMQKLLELKFQKKQHVFLKVLADEGRLRTQIREIEQMTQDAEDGSNSQMRAIGADIIWKSWVDRSKRSINMELAHVLAQKDQLKTKVQKEYGKVLVSKDLARVQTKKETSDSQRSKLNSAIQSYFYQNEILAKK